MWFSWEGINRREMECVRLHVATLIGVFSACAWGMLPLMSFGGSWRRLVKSSCASSWRTLGMSSESLPLPLHRSVLCAHRGLRAGLELRETFSGFGCFFWLGPGGLQAELIRVAKVLDATASVERCVRNTSRTCSLHDRKMGQCFAAGRDLLTMFLRKTFREKTRSLLQGGFHGRCGCGHCGKPM